MRRGLVAAASVLGALVTTMASFAGAAGPPAAAVEPILQRFLSRDEAPLRQYRAVRHLEARNPKFDMHGSMDAVTEVSPDGVFRFEILREDGSDYIRNKVLRPALQNEQKLFTTADPSRSALTPANYELAPGDLAGPDLVKLFAKPLRKDIALVDGALFVTRDDADLVRLEGRLTKNPSFWITRVDLVRHYERIAGFRVPVRLETTAQVRFAGASEMTVTYAYEMVNGVRVTPEP